MLDRDVKPGNFCRGCPNRHSPDALFLVDFGLSFPIDPGNLQTGMFVGTKTYASVLFRTPNVTYQRVIVAIRFERMRVFLSVRLTTSGRSCSHLWIFSQVSLRSSMPPTTSKL